MKFYFACENKFRVEKTGGKRCKKESTLKEIISQAD